MSYIVKIKTYPADFELNYDLGDLVCTIGERINSRQDHRGGSIRNSAGETICTYTVEKE